MKKINLGLIIIFVLINISCHSPKKKFSVTKYKNIVTKYTEIKQIPSEEVDDTFYVYIRLPKNYGSSDKSYPVLYLLDGDISFNMAVSIVRYLQFEKKIPDIIIVAPSYGTLLSDSETNFRERDYTISKNNRFEESGGASKYLNFLQKELIPLIDSSYRTNKKRILNGYSLGGLFTMNTLINSPETFDNYIVGSPYLIIDLDKLMEMLQNFNSTKVKNVFISFGELEEKTQYQIPIKTMVEKLNDIEKINIELRKFKGGTHFTCPSEALTYGLKFIYNSIEILEP